MKRKIEWYKEVLELEPSSKVFFPLARMLAENGENRDAEEALRQGLLRHPDHFEGRLLLVEVLRRQGKEAQVEEQVGSLTEKMSQYPLFWQSWADMLADRDGDKDSALALSLLAASLKGQAVDWADVIRLGLSSLLSGGAPVPAGREPEPAPSSDEDVVLLEEPIDDEEEEPEFEFETGVDEEEADDEASAGDFEFEAALVGLVDEEPAGRESVMEPDEDGDGEEVFTLRTRTMADVLAEQGDFEGALDIYRDLWRAQSAGSEKDELAEIIRDMEARMAESPEAGEERRAKVGRKAKPKAPDAANGLKGKKKLINTLESLAQRLEARAAG